jgi:presenilin-like A22 family membrane protease
LTASHRCPRRPLVVAFEVALAALAGGFAGLLLAAVLDPDGHTDTFFLVGGAAAGIAVSRVLLFR